MSNATTPPEPELVVLNYQLFYSNGEVVTVGWRVLKENFESFLKKAGDPQFGSVSRITDIKKLREEVINITDHFIGDAEAFESVKNLEWLNTSDSEDRS